jgi:hypothetical protein
MNRFFRWSAALVALACLTPAVADEGAATVQPVKLRFEPGFILEEVAQRMRVTLRPDVPLPAIFVESTTPLRQFQDAMQTQWRFRPPVVSNTYAIERNEIYLSDDASFYLRLKRTLDDSLAHELVHYIQAKYLNEDLSTDGCEVQAVEVQRWFREIHVQASPAVSPQEAGDGNLGGERLSNAPTCIITSGDGGARAVRCLTGSRDAPG